MHAPTAKQTSPPDRLRQHVHQSLVTTRPRLLLIPPAAHSSIIHPFITEPILLLPVPVAQPRCCAETKHAAACALLAGPHHRQEGVQAARHHTRQQLHAAAQVSKPLAGPHWPLHLHPGSSCGTGLTKINNPEAVTVESEEEAVSVASVLVAAALAMTVVRGVTVVAAVVVGERLPWRLLLSSSSSRCSRTFVYHSPGARCA